MAWYLNKYHCEACDTSWDDEWSCACNDHCPKCDKEIEPEDSIDETFAFVGLDDANSDGPTLVEISPETAEDRPDYVEHGPFPTRAAAEAFARENGWDG
jgi:hypothetical protein